MAGYTKTEPVIEMIGPTDEPDVLALNNDHAAELSWLDAPELSRLIGEAFHARRIGSLEAFLLTFDQDARYHSPNFLWFQERYPQRSTLSATEP